MRETTKRDNRDLFGTKKGKCFGPSKIGTFKTWGLDLNFSEHMFLIFKHFKTKGQVFFNYARMMQEAKHDFGPPNFI